MGGNLNGFWALPLSGGQNYTYGHNLYDAPLHKKQEYVCFRSGDVNSICD